MLYRNNGNGNKGKNKIRRFLSKCTLIVVRGNKNTLSNSKPCKKCLALIKTYGIKKIYYSQERQLIFEKVRDMTHEDCIVSKKYRVPWNEWG